MTSEFLQVAETVLSQLRKPMTARQIVDHAAENKMFSDRVAGKTPFQTMKAKLSVDIRTKGSDSRFVRTAPGQFFLRADLTNGVKEYSARPYVKPPPTERGPTVPIYIFAILLASRGSNRSPSVSHADC